MGVKVDFNYSLWQTTYPQFTNVDEAQATAMFVKAQTFHDNSGVGQPLDATIQLNLLNLLTAHLAALTFGIGNNTPGGFAGPISNASEGSVSVGIAVPQIPGSASWFLLTQFGQEYWYATAPYRTMHYRPGPVRYFGGGRGTYLVR